MLFLAAGVGMGAGGEVGGATTNYWMLRGLPFILAALVALETANG